MFLSKQAVFLKFAFNFKKTFQQFFNEPNLIEKRIEQLIANAFFRKRSQKIHTLFYIKKLIFKVVRLLFAIFECSLN